jgi:hypothetical protein
MNPPAAPRRKTALLVEFAFVLSVIASMVYTVWFLNWQGYLPQPYFYGSQSLFTDWTASVYYSVNPGAYTQFYSVYPPLSFDFLRIFSIHSCYKYDDIFSSRDCDWIMRLTLCGFFLATIPCVYYSYRVIDRNTAWMRTIAICFGLPLVYAMERGNLIVPTFTVFVLGIGRVLRSARWRWFFLALAINFKPYLILSIFGQLLRRRWRWFEGCAVMGLLVYLVTYGLEGDGSPVQILTNISLFATTDARGLFERSVYASSYIPLLDLFKSHFPVMHFIGSEPIEVLEIVLPLMVNIGRLGVVLAFIGTFFRPAAVPLFRLAALGLAYVVTTQDPGGYAIVFLLFLVFMEPWRGAARITALILAYVLSLSFDFIVVKFTHEIILSYLTNRTVGYDLGATVGMLLRPALIIFLEYALVAATFVDLARAGKPARADPSGGAHLALMPVAP